MTEDRECPGPYLVSVAHAKDPIGVAFAALIRDARRRRGWTQERLAEESGVGLSTILRWESGRTTQPLSQQVRAVCRVLGIDPRESAVALGYVTREEIGLPPPPPPMQLDPSDQEIVDLLRDPTVPRDIKVEWRDYILWQLSRRSQRGRRHGA